MTVPLDSASLSYHAIRMAWCRAALKSLLKRWGVYIVVGVLVLGGAANHAVAAMMALAAWSVLPLFQAAAGALQGGDLAWFLALLGTVAYGLLGAALVWGLTPILWPRAWAEAERALPIDPAHRRKSDCVVTLLGLAPLFATWWGGTAIWLVKLPPWFAPARYLGVALLCVAMLLAVALGVLILTWRRGLPVVVSSASAPRAWGAHTVLRPTADLAHRLPIPLALVLLPLLRGPARRTGHFFAASSVALIALSGAIALAPRHTPWWLAGFAALGLLLTTRLNGMAEQELKPLHQSCTALPIAQPLLTHWRLATAMLPLILSLACIGVALGWNVSTLRPMTLTFYVLAIALGNWVLAYTANRETPAQKQANAGARVAWWLLIGVVQIALASEVVAAASDSN